MLTNISILNPHICKAIWKFEIRKFLYMENSAITFAQGYMFQEIQ